MSEMETKTAIPARSESPIQPTSPSRELDLPTLINLAQPLLREWNSQETERQKAAMQHERELQEIDNRLSSKIFFGFLFLLSLSLGIAGFLFFSGRDGTAMDFIKLIVGLVGAVLGGYGWAKVRQRPQREE